MFRKQHLISGPRKFCPSFSHHINKGISNKKDTTIALTMSPGRKDWCISTLSISVALISWSLLKEAGAFIYTYNIGKTTTNFIRQITIEKERDKCKTFSIYLREKNIYLIMPVKFSRTDLVPRHIISAEAILAITLVTFKINK